MIIRKLFKFEGSHIVRNCTSKRCSHSIHGHSYKVEVFIESQTLDNAGMVMDFGLMGPFKEIIDMFDHTHLLWDKDDYEYREFIKKTNERWIELPCNPSAEMIATVLYYTFDRVLDAMRFRNGEGFMMVKAVRVHETDTGYAEASIMDVNSWMAKNNLELWFEDELPFLGIEVSPELICETWTAITRKTSIDNPMVKPQVIL